MRVERKRNVIRVQGSCSGRVETTDLKLESQILKGSEETR